MASEPYPSLSSRLKLRHILLITALDEHRSVLRASQALNMTQPAASKLLHQLEETLGVTVFDRHARGVEPTAYGEVLVRHARAAITELRHAQDEISALRSGLSGQVAIGTEAASATTLVPQAVVLLKQRFPQVSVSIEHAFSETVIGMLLAGKLDIAIARIQNVRQRAELNYEPLGEALHVMVARTGHPLTERRELTLQDLVSQTWVVPPQGNVMRSYLTLLFLERHLPFPNQVIETASLRVMVSLLRMSDMVTPMPQAVARAYCDWGVLAELPIRLDLRPGTPGIVTRRNQIPSPAAQAMLKALHEVAEQLRAGEVRPSP